MLYEIMYCSMVNPDITKDDISSILEDSRKYNEDHQITGCLLFYNNHFLQVLEGPRENLEILEHKIKNDPRHYGFEVLERGEITRRMYPNWTMAFNDDKPSPDTVKNGRIDLDEFVDLSNLTRKTSTAKNLFWTLSQELFAETE